MRSTLADFRLPMSSGLSSLLQVIICGPWLNDSPLCAMGGGSDFFESKEVLGAGVNASYRLGSDVG